MAMRVSSALHRCWARLRAILISAPGVAGRYARRRWRGTFGRRSCFERHPGGGSLEEELECGAALGVGEGAFGIVVEGVGSQAAEVGIGWVGVTEKASRRLEGRLEECSERRARVLENASGCPETGERRASGRGVQKQQGRAWVSKEAR